MNTNSQSNLFHNLGSSQGVFSQSSTGQQQSGQNPSPFGGQGQSIFNNAAQTQGQTQGQGLGMFGTSGQNQGQTQNAFQTNTQNQGQNASSGGQNVFGQVPQQTTFSGFGGANQNKAEDKPPSFGQQQTKQ